MDGVGHDALASVAMAPIDPASAALRAQDFHEALKETTSFGPKEVHFGKTLSRSSAGIWTAGRSKPPAKRSTRTSAWRLSAGGASAQSDEDAVLARAVESGGPAGARPPSGGPAHPARGLVLQGEPTFIDALAGVCRHLWVCRNRPTALNTRVPADSPALLLGTLAEAATYAA